ncbi:MAG: sugar phosphate isomerase/epimerase [Bacteroidetes bacterium]|nr:sugar phosphate isomerase/epimerase [Bacteroidota bacterium]
MNSRRRFLKNSGSALLGGLVASNYASAFFKPTAMHPVGLQLFTLFGAMDKDASGTLKQVAAIGYKELESAFSFKGGFYGMKPKEFAAMTKDLGLSWQSHHVLGTPFKMPPGGIRMPGADTTKKFNPPPMRTLKENMQELVDEVAEGGAHYMVCASIALGTADEIKEAIVILSKSGEACKKAGLTLCYHNHTHEFETVEGKIPYHELLTQVSPDLLKMELDLGWATNAGADPVDLFSKHPGRFPLWHVKDMTKDTKQPTEVGAGYIDFKRIFEHADASGMKHFFVEQDGAPKPFENIAASYKALTKIMS